MNAWFDKLFVNDRPHNCYLGGDWEEIPKDSHIFIINDVVTTMPNDLLAFDLAQATDLILGVCNAPGSTRTKHLIETVRGQGGGKTRALEEIRKRFMTDTSHVLPIMITFNNWTPFDETTDKSFEVSVVARMAVVLYDKTLDSVYEMFTQNGQGLNGFEPISLIQGFVLHAMGRVNELRSDQVTHFVLGIDELVQGSRSSHNPKDPLCNLRKALLQKFDPYRCALVVSSLEAAPLGFTESGRAIFPLKLPATLDPEEIMQKWWKIEQLPCFLQAENQDKLRSLLLLLAQALTSTPGFRNGTRRIFPIHR